MAAHCPLRGAVVVTHFWGGLGLKMLDERGGHGLAPPSTASEAALFRAPSILPALTIFLIAIPQISASFTPYAHENRPLSDTALVSTSQCSHHTKIFFSHYGTNASFQLRARKPLENLPTSILETLPTTPHDISLNSCGTTADARSRPLCAFSLSFECTWHTRQ